MPIKIKPTKEDLLTSVKNKQASYWRNKVPDVIDYNLKVLFCGINPGLYTAWAKHHFAHPGNRFWKTLYLSGFTPTLLTPYQNSELLKFSLGITNIVERPTITASELSKEELINGGKILVKKILKYKPEYAAIVGIDAYRIAFQKKSVKTGLQEDKIGQTKVWVLPNPSGLNANYPPQKLVEVFKEFYNQVTNFNTKL